MTRRADARRRPRAEVAGRRGVPRPRRERPGSRRFLAGSVAAAVVSLAVLSPTHGATLTRATASAATPPGGHTYGGAPADLLLAPQDLPPAEADFRRGPVEGQAAGGYPNLAPAINLACGPLGVPAAWNKLIPAPPVGPTGGIVYDKVYVFADTAAASQAFSDCESGVAGLGGSPVPVSGADDAGAVTLEAQNSTDVEVVFRVSNVLAFLSSTVGSESDDLADAAHIVAKANGHEAISPGAPRSRVADVVAWFLSPADLPDAQAGLTVSRSYVEMTNESLHVPGPTLLGNPLACGPYNSPDGERDLSDSHGIRITERVFLLPSAVVAARAFEACAASQGEAPDQAVVGATEAIDTPPTGSSCCWVMARLSNVFVYLYSGTDTQQVVNGDLSITLEDGAHAAHQAGTAASGGEPPASECQGSIAISPTPNGFEEVNKQLEKVRFEKLSIPAKVTFAKIFTLEPSFEPGNDSFCVDGVVGALKQAKVWDQGRLAVAARDAAGGPTTDFTYSTDVFGWTSESGTLPGDQNTHTSFQPQLEVLPVRLKLTDNGKLQVPLTLGSVDVMSFQATAKLIWHRNAVLTAMIGPKLSYDLEVKPQALLDELGKDAMETGSGEAAADEVAKDVADNEAPALSAEIAGVEEAEGAGTAGEGVFGLSTAQIESIVQPEIYPELATALTSYYDGILPGSADATELESEGVTADALPPEVATALEESSPIATLLCGAAAAVPEFDLGAGLAEDTCWKTVG